MELRVRQLRSGTQRQGAETHAIIDSD